MTPDDLDRGAPKRPVSRRALLRGSAATGGLLALGGLARGARATPPPRTPPTLVVVELRGGNDGLNTVVPVQLASYAPRRGALALAAGECLSLASGPAATESYKLHPALPRLRGLWQRGELAVVHKVGYPSPSLSHFQSLNVLEQGVRGSFASAGVPSSGWVARYADRYAAQPFGAVQVGAGRAQAILGGQTRLLHLDKLANYLIHNDPASWTSHLYRLQVIQTMLGRPAPATPGDAAAALRLTWAIVPSIQQALASYPGNLAAYPSTPIGAALQDIGVLLAAGTGTRVFYTGFEGFDTHAGQGTTQGTHAQLLADLDAALDAFVQDQRALGTWPNLVVAVVSEFGRRTPPNASGGSDHGAAGPWFVCGGAVRGGLYGPDLTDADLAGDQIDYAVDFRTVYEEILARHLGASAQPWVFPEAWSSTGRLGFL